jgi:hypothetical protein
MIDEYEALFQRLVSPGAAHEDGLGHELLVEATTSA